MWIKLFIFANVHIIKRHQMPFDDFMKSFRQGPEPTGKIFNGSLSRWPSDIS